MENQNSKAAVITPSYWDEGDYRCVRVADGRDRNG